MLSSWLSEGKLISVSIPKEVLGASPHLVFRKEKGKGKQKSKSMGPSDPRLKGLNLAWRTPDGRELCFAWNTGECDGSCGRIHQCRVKGCYSDHKAVEHKQKQGA